MPPDQACPPWWMVQRSARAAPGGVLVAGAGVGMPAGHLPAGHRGGKGFRAPVRAAIERLLALLSTPPAEGIRIRRDIIVNALIDACQDEPGSSGPTAERIATACLGQLDNPSDEYEATAEAAVVAALPATEAAKDRAVGMLPRPQPRARCRSPW
jgi:hypothetical protein